MTTLISGLLLMLSEVFVVIFIYSIMLYINWKFTLLISTILIVNAFFLTVTVSKAIKKAGGKVIRVVRGTDPEWYEIASESNKPGSFNHMATAYPDVHASEWAWAGTEFDAIIDNNGTVDDLYKQLAGIV